MSHTIGIYTRDHVILRTQRDARVHLAGASGTPSAYSLERFEAPILDQGPTSSCIGHGSSQGVFISYAAAGKPLAWTPSPKVIYDLARILNRVSPADGLQDNGAMPAFAIAALSGFGVTAMLALSPDGRNSDVTPDDVNAEPSFLELEESGLKLTTGEFRIDETSSTFGEQITAAISGSSGKPPCSVCFGAFVDTENFMAYNGETPITTINVNDPNGGGHWFVGSYYYHDPVLGLIIGGPGSWGTSYGKNGHHEITAAALQAVTSDCYLMNVGGQ